MDLRSSKVIGIAWNLRSAWRNRWSASPEWATAGDLRIVPKGNHLFHPKLYLFERPRNGIVVRQAWIGSANFTRAGFGGHSNANEEIVLEVGPGDRADALADWFQQRWDHCRVDSRVSEVIRRYTEDWKRSPPHRHMRQITSGSVSDPRDLLDDDAHRPLSLEGYRQALSECEEHLRGEGRGWTVVDPQGRSYMRVISDRRKLLLGKQRWSELDVDSQKQLKGSYRRKDLKWWGLTGNHGSQELAGSAPEREEDQDESGRCSSSSRRRVPGHRR
ncbi:MAG: phospholipase D-like domain-containing protein [Gemmatimonadetes bacterium]|nr:phospholipase D-like domain-containing protein [Gemmatimonadota bacterium]